MILLTSARSGHKIAIDPVGIKYCAYYNNGGGVSGTAIVYEEGVKDGIKRDNERFVVKQGVEEVYHALKAWHEKTEHRYHG